MQSPTCLADLGERSSQASRTEFPKNISHCYIGRTSKRGGELSDAAYHLSPNLTESTLARTLEARAKDAPSRPYIIDRGAPLTYARLDEQSRRMARALLDLGVKPGD